MALRVFRSTAQVVEGHVKRNLPAMTTRGFADKADEPAEDLALMEDLKNQVINDNVNTVLPDHVRDSVHYMNEVDPIIYPEETSIVSGVEEWSRGRKVRIGQLPRHQMQSGLSHTHHWEIRVDKGPTWQNPLMGWVSTAEPFQSLVMKFDTKEQATAYAKKQGWDIQYEESSDEGDMDGKITYAHNFLPVDVENLIKRDGKKAHVHFKHPTGRRSNWVKTLKYHGNGVVAQHGGEAKKK